ncbi:hypothetical protein M3Y97_00322500 [Aphelenchoides bicaudatus]|nr:hypothetical protein M3Y97_00322500 [Aphelenchoides bicaudatus]
MQQTFVWTMSVTFFLSVVGIVVAAPSKQSNSQMDEFPVAGQFYAYQLNDGYPLNSWSSTFDELDRFAEPDDRMKRSVALGRAGFRPSKRSVALGRSKFRPAKRSVANGRSGFRPAKRGLEMSYPWI